LLEEGGLHGARAVLLNISASGNLSLHEMFEACRLIKEATGNEDVQINFGLVPDESLGDEVKITVIATGFERKGLPEVDASAILNRTHEAQPAFSAPRAGFSPRSVPASVIPVDVVREAPEPVITTSAIVDMPAFEPEPALARTPEEPIIDLELLADGPPVAPLLADNPPPQPASAPPPPAPPARSKSEDDPFTIDDLDTPAFLKRERKLFQ